jgi:hypothetical protein
MHLSEIRGKIPAKWRDGRAQRGNSKEELTQVVVFALVVYFFNLH